jgi:hypothetical protein
VKRGTYARGIVKNPESDIDELSILLPIIEARSATPTECNTAGRRLVVVLDQLFPRFETDLVSLDSSERRAARAGKLLALRTMAIAGKQEGILDSDRNLSTKATSPKSTRLAHGNRFHLLVLNGRDQGYFILRD